MNLYFHYCIINVNCLLINKNILQNFSGLPKFLGADERDRKPFLRHLLRHSRTPQPLGHRKTGQSRKSDNHCYPRQRDQIWWNFATNKVQWCMRTLRSNEHWYNVTQNSISNWLTSAIAPSLKVLQNWALNHFGHQKTDQSQNSYSSGCYPQCDQIWWNFATVAKL